MAFDIFQYFWCGCFVIWKRNHLSIILLECMYLISFSPIFYPQRVPIFFFFFLILFSYRDKAAANSLEFVYSSELKVGVLYYNLIIQHWHYFKLKNNRYSTCGLKANRLFKSFQCLTLKWNHRMTPASCSPFLQTELSLYIPTCTCKIPSRIGAPYLQYLSCGSGSS